MQEELTNQALPITDVCTPIALYHIYPRKKPALGRLSLINNRTDQERANGWVCDASVLVRRDDSQALLDAKDAEIADLKQEAEHHLKALAACRDAFPAPPVNTDLDHLFVSAIGQPESVAEYVKAALAVKDAKLAALVADLKDAAATLRRYEILHRAKGTAESSEKAEVNAALAARFEATIAQAVQLDHQQQSSIHVGFGSIQGDSTTRVQPADEQSVFETWLADKCPSGDHECVQRQWESSSEYKDFLAQAVQRADGPLMDEGTKPADDGWPKLVKPASLLEHGAGTFGKGVSSRLLVEAAYRHHERTQVDRARTPEQRRADEMKRRKGWDLFNGGLVTPECEPLGPTINEHIEGWRAQTQFACEYKHGGKTWGLEFFAIDAADAEDKLQSIRQSLVILGALDSMIPIDDAGMAEDVQP